MAIDQGISRIKFKNTKGVELPNTNWIAGVDYEEEAYKIKNNNEVENMEDIQDNTFDPTYIQLSREPRDDILELDEVIDQ